MWASPPLGAFVIVSVAALTRITVSGIYAETTGPTSDVFGSMGVFGGALAIAYYMLRRGDRREQELMQANQADSVKTEQALAELAVRHLQSLELVAKLQGEIIKLTRPTDSRTRHDDDEPT